ncbi:MAG TPA: di-trans,poly-cis-decaprenylcistransferase [Candidatus Bathyarchaeota archaeon]|nr:MAG: di-trans,poly-cis-decaprenylcistransferase [Candidatus Bathyarchaeota archaeon]RLI29175.1 MAG: di-trans,poly-cis-decaprenylcistransferase [Candidatus Bathyarchaeota archaeon]HDI06840.1 di-trans,poly-cis-decaprenylcistransferase [Candidatus Bathyarchaeota archaeon]
MLKGFLSVIGAYKLYEKWLWHQIKNGRKPEHIAVILDGNRRWAMKKALNPWIGHRQGAEKVEKFLDWCFDLKVKSITLYAFSTENFRRPKREVDEIMRILEEKLRKLFSDERIYKNKVRVRVIGRRVLLPDSLQKLIAEVEEKTKNFDQHFLNIAIAYGGRAEIVDAAKKIAEKVSSGEITPDAIDEEVFEKHLYTAYLPKQDPDLIIRTSGEERLSGFLLWQSAYSELCFLDVYWPEFRRIDLLRAVRIYQKRQRRFGR